MLTDDGRWPDALVQVDDGAGWLALSDPADEVVGAQPHEVAGALERVERETAARGWHAAGFVSFEAGAAFGLAARQLPRELPLAWFGLYRTCRPLHRLPAVQAEFSLGPIEPSIDRPTFERAIEAIHRHLTDGDTYQVNFTFPLSAAFKGDARALWLALVRAQRCRYGAFLRCGRHAICSASPELFFSREGEALTSRPMKGTAPRGRTALEDAAQAEALTASAKTRAENVMIVDMVRNDLGRVADIGSVQVDALCSIEPYPTLLQMVSTVTARSRAPLAEIFAAMHPAASVTGAPKVRTMEIIASLESRPRGVYTGAIGLIRPDGRAQFNVGIRTAVVNEARSTLTFGVGAGIVADSSASSEYDECLLKGRILTSPPPVFELLETLRWNPRHGYVLLEGHLARLAGSARYFGVPCDLARVRRQLADAVGGRKVDQRVRLLIDNEGVARVEVRPLDRQPRRVEVHLATRAIDTSTPFVFHKTTHRKVYEDAQAGLSGEVIFWNSDGCVTESTNANVVVEIDGRLVTPPVESGLLAGVARADALRRGRVSEAIVTVAEFRTARRAWLLNSVRGWRPISSRVESDTRPGA